MLVISPATHTPLKVMISHLHADGIYASFQLPSAGTTAATITQLVGAWLRVCVFTHTHPGSFLFFFCAVNVWMFIFTLNEQNELPVAAYVYFTAGDGSSDLRLKWLTRRSVSWEHVRFFMNGGVWNKQALLNLLGTLLWGSRAESIVGSVQRTLLRCGCFELIFPCCIMDCDAIVSRELFAAVFLL